MTGMMFNNFNYSQMNYDMLSQNPLDTMNLHINQMADHSRATFDLYKYPSYNLSNFSQYPGVGFSGMNSIGGTPAWMNNMNPVGGGNATSSSATCDDPEEEAFKLKYKKLETLVKALADSKDLSDDEKAELKVAMKNAKGTWEEKFYTLHEAYECISDEKVKDFLKENGHKLGVSKDIKSNASDSDSFYNRLLKAGFEYTDTAVDTLVTDFHTKLSTELKSNAGTSTGANGVIANVVGKGNVVDFMSSWNSRYPDKKIFKFIGENWSKVQSENKENVYKFVVTPLVNGLIKEANEVNRYLDDASRKNMDSAIADLTKALNNSSTSIAGNLQEKFDKVYLLTRLGAMQKIREDAMKFYEGVDDDLFDSDLFRAEVVEDLRKEGFNNIPTVSLSGETRPASKDKDSSDATSGADPAFDKTKEEIGQEKHDIEQAGKNTSKRLNGGTSAEEIRAIKTDIEMLNKDNILTFLNAFYEEEGYGGEGLIEAMDDDDDEEDEKIIGNSLKIGILEMTLEKAKEMGLQDNEHYKKLTGYINEFNRRGYSEHAGLGDYEEGFFNDIEFSDLFDDELEALHKVMKNK